ncbi:MarR family EPS-associated transcriptional regulator [Marinomonas sp. NPDC078689]|uniref:MarR family EPS-associated transcriptional regulator n=1 Tax=Marinomonas sp. NPDC078689 TaxID=3364147 RepID=UPI0037C585E0
MLTDEYRYKILKELQYSPDLSQRELAKRLGISLGKTNFCLKALIEKGLIKAGNFKRSTNKAKYLYLLTPTGIEAKARLTRKFLHKKLQEHEALALEIESLREEAAISSEIAPEVSQHG